MPSAQQITKLRVRRGLGIDLRGELSPRTNDQSTGAHLPNGAQFYPHFPGPVYDIIP